MPTDTATTARAHYDTPTVRQLLDDPNIIGLLARPLNFPATESERGAASPDDWMNGATTPDQWLALLDTLTRELTVSFDTFEALATDHGRIDELGNLYRPTLRADRDPRYAILADAYDAYQVARGCAKRALRG